MKALINGKIILRDGIYEDKVLIMDERIREVINRELFNLAEEIEIIDVMGNYISPGFMDIHIHGAGGRDTMDESIEALNIISKTIVRNGTTSFLSTTMTRDMNSVYNVIDLVREAMTMELDGAKILGLHMEGPFINKQMKGAQREDYIIRADYELIKDHMDIIKIITMAPEVEGSKEFIKSIKAVSNIILSIGHSNATYEETLSAIEEGITHGTHLFNAMSPLHHRNPGVVGALLNSNTTCELIADNIHVHPSIYQLLIKIKGLDKLILVSDGIRAASMEDGQYELGGQEVSVKDGQAKLEDGTLAGSVLKLNEAVKNFREATKAPLHEIIKLLAFNPAKLIRMDHKKGSIEIGKDSDIIVFDDNIEIKMAFVGGKIKDIS